jgi:hypothetical protein
VGRAPVPSGTLAARDGRPIGIQLLEELFQAGTFPGTSSFLPITDTAAN